MSTFIIYIGKDSKGKEPAQEVIDEVIRRHRTEQDSVIIKKIDQKLDGGFDVVKEDDTVTNVLKRDSDIDKSLNYIAIKDKAKEAKIIKDGAVHSHDTTVTKGVKPIGNNK